MTQDEIDRQFNERVANRAHQDTLRAEERTQKDYAAQGFNISRREAGRILKERNEAQMDEKRRVEQAVDKAKPPGIDNLLKPPTGVHAFPSVTPGKVDLPNESQNSANHSHLTVPRIAGDLSDSAVQVYTTGNLNGVLAACVLYGTADPTPI